MDGRTWRDAYDHGDIYIYLMEEYKIYRFPWKMTILPSNYFHNRTSHQVMRVGTLYMGIVWKVANLPHLRIIGSSAYTRVEGQKDKSSE